MIINFKKGYYQEAEKNEENQFVVTGKDKPMYTFKAEKNYYTGDKTKVLKEVIQDLEKELEKLKQIDEKNDKAMESWESITK